jgi:hypothetical protein
LYLVPAAVLLLLSTGCSSQATGTVSGAVMFNGQPLAHGAITFSPLDASGGTAGADIVAGRYQVANLQPGKYQVHIAGAPEGKVVMPGDPETKRTLSDAEIRARMDPIPPGASGNDQTIEVKAGMQTHDFKLESQK